MSTFSRGKKKVIIISSIIILIIIILSLALIGYKNYKSTHYSKGTIIQGVDCSNLTVKKAKQEIEKSLSSKVAFVFLKDGNNKTAITYYAKNIKREIANDKQLQIALEAQKNDAKQKEFNYENFFSVNEQEVRKCLKEVFKLQEQYLVQSKDAYLQLTENEMKIVPEIYGTEIEFEVALKKAIDSLKNSVQPIDFRPLVNKPKVLSTNETLVKKCNEANKLLNTKLEFNLSDGTNLDIALDKNTIINWFQASEDGQFYIDNTQSNLSSFVDSLLEKANVSESTFMFPATNINPNKLKIRKDLIGKINKEEAVKQIQNALGTKATITLNYEVEPITKRLNNYIELDITRQTLWFYKDGKCILKSLCVTGSVAGGHSTPTGMYFLDAKQTNTYLRGYNNDGSRYTSFVNYWMPFNGGVGFHDASWRNGRFGGQIYKTNGSHGCVNLPYNSAKTLYENINSSTLIIIYKS